MYEACLGESCVLYSEMSGEMSALSGRLGYSLLLFVELCSISSTTLSGWLGRGVGGDGEGLWVTLRLRSCCVIRVEVVAEVGRAGMRTMYALQSFLVYGDLAFCSLFIHLRSVDHVVRCSPQFYGSSGSRQ